MNLGRISTSRLLQGAGGLTVTLGAACSMLLTTSVPALAGGNAHFEGVLDAAMPTGFLSSPTPYDVSSGPVTVNFDTLVKNLTGKSQTFTLSFSLHHILTYNGQNVADGQPGQPGITFSGPQNTTQVLMPGTQTFSVTWSAHQTQTVARSFSLDTCGYFQVDMWAPAPQTEHSARARATLASAFIRALGCSEGGETPTPTPTPTPTSTPTPTATPTPTPTGAPGPTPTASPTPASGVGAAVSPTTPGTGAASGTMPFAGSLLIIVGLASMGVGTGLRYLRRR